MVYLKGLNGIRALAVWGVVTSHIHNAINASGDEDTRAGSYAVTAFFSLSGFLITYLLLREKEMQPVDVKRFYIRRVLRIWPLYFLYMGIALFFTAPPIFPDVLYYIFFIPNVPWVFGGIIPLLGHYWSLGVEEQFYLFWPWLIKISRRLLLFLCLFIAVVFLIKLYVNLFVGGWSDTYSFVYEARFDCMAIGGIGAVLFRQKHRILLMLSSHITQVVCWLAILLVAFNEFHTFSIIDHEIVAVVIVTLIIGQITDRKPLIDLENYTLNFFGKISFGIYVYHAIIIEFVTCSSLSGLTSPKWYAFIVYLIVCPATVLVAGLSYYFFERHFLALKNKYSFQKM